MAALGTNLVTLADVAKSQDKQIGAVAEVLTLENPMLNDIPYMEMNGGVIHTEDIRSGLPEVFYRKANEAIPPTKSTIEERTYSAAHFESKSQMDEKVASRGGADRIAYNRWNQAMGHIQAQANEHAALTIYGSPLGNPQKTPGLFDIYSTKSGETGKQIIDAGGTGGDNMSILLVHWGERSVFGVYPKGTTAGLKRTDRSAGGKLVKIIGTTATGAVGDFHGYEEQFEIDHGLVVKDYRQAGRIANIDLSDLQGGSGADLIELMIMLSYKIHTAENGTGVWYVNRTIEAFLHLQALNKVSAGAGLTFENFDGKRVLTMLGRPVRRSDALLNSEARVV